MKKGSDKKKKGVLKKRFIKTRLCVYGFLLAVCINSGVQLFHKPAELFALVPWIGSKSPELTWKSYYDEFRAASYRDINATFLAALTQTESGGDPLASPEWRWRWTKNWKKIYSPASSAFGLMQLTDGTFKQAQRLCRDDRNRIRKFGPDKKCRWELLTFRALPSHSIALTANHLGYHVYRLLRLHGRQGVSRREAQKLAAVIHLCGVRRGREFIRKGFQPERVGTCGAHNVAHFVGKVVRLESRFRGIQSRYKLASTD